MCTIENIIIGKRIPAIILNGDENNEFKFILISDTRLGSKYQQLSILNDIYSNTILKNISYYNKSNNYYIVKDDKYVYVFDLNYDKVYSKDISELSASKLDIVYRRSNIYYEDKVRDKDKLTYKYYDVSTLEEVFDIDVGGI